MLEKHIFRIDSVRVLVVDEVDFLFYSSKQVGSVRKLLTSFSSCDKRQTVFASASIPQHKHFVHDCIQQKWTKRDVVHVHVSAIMPMPLCLLHRFVVRHNLFHLFFHYMHLLVHLISTLADV
jgi:superfamily II DNA/RNA helicase